MSRRLYTSSSGYRPVTEQGERSTRISISSSVLTSKPPSTLLSNSSQKSTFESSSSLLSNRRSLLSEEVGRSRSRYDDDSNEEFAEEEDSDVRLSPKPMIRKYGRTTHSQAFASRQSNTPPSLPTSSDSTTTTFSSSLTLSSIHRSGRRIQDNENNVNEERIIRDRTRESVLETVVHERQPRKVEVVKVEDSVSQRTRHRLRTAGEPGFRKSDESEEKDERIRVESRLEAGWRTMTSFSSEAQDRGGGDGSASERSNLRLRRQQILDDVKTSSQLQTRPQMGTSDDNEETAKDVTVRQTKAYLATTEAGNSRNNIEKKTGKGISVMVTKASLETEVRSSDDNERDVLGKETQASLETDVRRPNAKLQRRYGVKKKSEVIEKETYTGTVKITVSTEDNEDSGVYLEDSTSSGPDKLPGRGHSPVRNQWTEEDLEAFVLQLSNPQHHVTKISPRDQPDTSGSWKSSIDVSKDRLTIRAHLARSETDASSENTSTNDDKDSKDDERVSRGLSGLRLIGNKKLAKRSQYSTTDKYVENTREEFNEPSSLTQEDFDESADNLTSLQDDSFVGMQVACNSSPDSSDPETYDDRKTPEQTLINPITDVSKKSRFRKMLSRPLTRAHSAGCAKDVPALALFRNTQQKSGKETQAVHSRGARLSEGDIRFPVQAVTDEFAEKESLPNHLCITDITRSLTGRIHKTKSADSAILSTDDLVVISQPKSKTRNIAKKISRKMLFLRRRHTDSTLGMIGNDEGARRLANVDPGEAKEWSKSFENLLYDKIGLELFRGFLMTEHSDENIEFWIACENYKTSKSNKQLPSLAMKIFTDYVAVQSKKEVNLDSKTRTFTYESVTTNPTRQTFDEAQRRVQALMEKDSYRRFLESELYQDLASGNLQQKS